MPWMPLKNQPQPLFLWDLGSSGSGDLGSLRAGQGRGPQGSGREETAWAGWRLQGSCSELSRVFQVVSVCQRNKRYSAPRHHL